MPQTFQVLRCYKCFVFQVHQTKKSVKWDCKLCGEKQSIKRHYGMGTGRDCRLHVQKLNTKRGEIDELKCGQMLRNAESDEENNVIDYKPIIVSPKNTKISKWTNYVENVEHLDEADKEPMCLGDTEVVLEMPKKQKKQFKKPSISNNYKSVSPQHRMQNTCSKDLSCNNIMQYEDSKKVLKEKLLIKPQSDHQIKEETSKQNVAIQKIVPVINKNSKWAHFIEDEGAEEECIEEQSLEEPIQNDYMFSLCQDVQELDDILDI